MALSEERTQKICLDDKNHENAEYGECWSIIDGVVVIYHEDNQPGWLAEVLAKRDEDGNVEQKSRWES